MTRRAALVAKIACVALVAASAMRAPAASDRVRAVVADISPGTNPYHEVFRRPGWTEHPCAIVPGLPCSMPNVKLTLGDDYRASLETDVANGVWAAYKSRPGVVHWVPGTNLLLVTLRSWETTSADIHDGYGGRDVFHGLATSAAIADACPECYVLVVQDSGSIDGEPLRYVTRELPWVDFAATTNFPGYDPGTYARYAAASFAFAESGGLLFVPSGNYVVSTLTGYPPPASEQSYMGLDLPPWVVMVGGALKRLTLPDRRFDRCDATAVDAGKPADFVGDFSQRLPTVETVSGYGVLSGTSFATPQIAGRFAAALVEVRRRLGDSRETGALWAGPPRPTPFLEDGRLTAPELRSAVSRTAELFATANADPACIAAAFEATSRSRPTTYVPVARTGVMYAPASPAPWLEMGWGYVDFVDAERAAAGIAGETELPRKPPAAEAYMAAVLAVRETAYPRPPAANCNGVVTEIATPAGTYYVDVRKDSLWIYEESNGRPGLQSGGGGDDCEHDDPDTVIL